MSVHQKNTPSNQRNAIVMKNQLGLHGFSMKDFVVFNHSNRIGVSFSQYIVRMRFLKGTRKLAEIVEPTAVGKIVGLFPSTDEVGVLFERKHFTEGWISVKVKIRDFCSSGIWIKKPEDPMTENPCKDIVLNTELGPAEHRKKDLKPCVCNLYPTSPGGISIMTTGCKCGAIKEEV